MSLDTLSPSVSAPQDLGEPFPFTEVGSVRTFSADTDPLDLKWHWDEQPRLVSPTHETDWLLQLDNCMPQSLDVGVMVFIDAGVWHRLIKGTGSLAITVIKQ